MSKGTCTHEWVKTNLPSKDTPNQLFVQRWYTWSVYYIDWKEELTRLCHPLTSIQLQGTLLYCQARWIYKIPPTHLIEPYPTPIVIPNNGLITFHLSHLSKLKPCQCHATMYVLVATLTWRTMTHRYMFEGWTNSFKENLYNIVKQEQPATEFWPILYFPFQLCIRYLWAN